MKFYSTEVFPLSKEYKKDEDWYIFQDIVFRAEKIISEFPKEKIDEYGKIVIGWLQIFDFFYHSPDHCLNNYMPDEDLEGLINFSNAFLIKNDYYELEANAFNISNWELVFALVSLYEIDHCMLFRSIISSGKISYPNYTKKEHYFSVALSALEAVILAENAKEQSFEIEKIVKSQRREQAKKAALERHRPTHELCSEFIKFYFDGNFKSKSNAADKFIDILEKEKRNILSPTNAKRTLLDALRKFIKEELDKYK